jgi:hypothetical protein
MTTEKISRQAVQALPNVSGEVPKPKDKAVTAEKCDDLKALRDSLEMKRQLLTLLDKGGYVKDVATIKTDVDRAIADLDEIIKALPDEEYPLHINNL